MDREKIKVTVWNEFREERTMERIHDIYPQGIHQVIADMFNAHAGFEARCAWLDQDDDHGLSAELLADTDVLFWWGHLFHREVRDEIVERVAEQVQSGMGLVVLHSGHMSKIFRRLMGTSCTLRWRDDDQERIWVVDPNHPIARGLPPCFELPQTEMYGERFDIPTPEDVVFINWYAGGEVFRGGVTFRRGNGRIFYFSPGDESYPIYYDAHVQQVLRNAAEWAAPSCPRNVPECFKAGRLPSIKKNE